MATLTAKFRMVDETSQKLSKIAEIGQRAGERLERVGKLANQAFEKMSKGAKTVADTTEKAAQAARKSVTQSQKYEQASRQLSSAIAKAGEKEKNLASAMEQTVQVSKELLESDKVSAQTKEKLAAASQQAENAMKGLTDAQENAKNTMSEYRRILSENADDHEVLEAAMKKVKAASAELSSANKLAEGSAKKFSDATEKAGKEAEKAGKKAEEAGNTGQTAIDQLKDALVAAGITKLVMEIVGAFMAASEAASQFETALMKISTIADTSKTSLSQISSEIMALSRQTGQDVYGLSDAVYSAISASVNTSDAVPFTATATKLATGGFTSSATAVDVLTTALNAYKLEASEAENISNMLITTQNLGKTTVDELAASVGKVIPLASAYSVEMDNLSAAYAELTKGGIATAEAGTYLKSMLSELGDSGSAVAETLLEQTGNSFAQLMEQGYSLGDVMKVLGDSVNGNAGAFNELWSSSEAGIGALSLYNAGAEQFNTTLDAMRNSAGATANAYNAMTDTTAHAQQELSNAANNLKISIGENLNPLMKSLYQWGADILNGMSEFAEQHPIVTKGILAITIGITTFGAAMVAVTAIKKLFFVQTVANTAATAAEAAASTAAVAPIVALGAAFNAALGPIGWLIVGITAFGAAIGSFALMVGNSNQEIKDMTATTRAQYYELQDLNAEYEATCAQLGEASPEAERLRYQVDELTASFEANRKTTAQLKAEIEALYERHDELVKSYEDGMKSIKDEELGALALVRRLEDLQGSMDGSALAGEKMKAVVDELNKTNPSLSLQYDEATRSINRSTEAIRNLIKEQVQRERESEALNSWKEFEIEKQKAEETLAELEKNKAQYEKDKAAWDEQYKNVDRKVRFSYESDYQDTLKEIEEITAAIAETSEKIRECESVLGQTEEEIRKAMESVQTPAEAANLAFDSTRGHVEELIQSYQDLYAETKASFEGQFGLFEQAQIKSELTVSQMIANLESQAKAWEDYSANLQKLSSMGYADDLIEKLSDGSTESMADVAQMAKASKAQVEQMNQEWAKVGDKISEAAETVADQKSNIENELTALIDAMKEQIKQMSLETEAKESANKMIDSYAQAILAGRSSAVTAAQSVSNAVASVLSGQNPVLNSIGSVLGNITSAVNTVVKVPANANGTLNAAPAFIAGEQGPELVARRAAAYATGTTNSTDFFIAGEHGPELIIGEQGSTVFPTEETDRLIASLNNRERRFPVLPNFGDSKDSDTNYSSKQEKHVYIHLDGMGTIELTGHGMDEDTVLEFLSENLKPVIMQLIQKEAYEEGDGSYDY